MVAILVEMSDLGEICLPKQKSKFLSTGAQAAPGQRDCQTALLVC